MLVFSNSVPYAGCNSYLSSVKQDVLNLLISWESKSGFPDEAGPSKKLPRSCKEIKDASKWARGEES